MKLYWISYPMLHEQTKHHYVVTDDNGIITQTHASMLPWKKASIEELRKEYQDANPAAVIREVSLDDAAIILAIGLDENGNLNEPQSLTPWEEVKAKLNLR